MPRSRRPPGALSRALCALLGLCCVASLFAAETSSAPPAATSLVEGRILSSEPSEGGRLLTFEVSRVHRGFLAASVVVLREPSATDGCGGGSRDALRTGERRNWTLELVLRRDVGEDWRIDCARRSGSHDVWVDPADPTVSFPPLLIAETPDPGPDLERSRVRVGSAVSTPTFEQEVVRLVNVFRQDNGNLPPLKHHDQLETSADTHSENMGARDFFAHCDLDTSASPWNRINAAGYSYYTAAENIAAGYSTPAAAVNGWANSPGHRANMLASHLHELGAGYFYDSGDSGNIRRDLNGDCTADSFNNGPYGRYWTQNFGWRNGVFPVVIEREEHSTTSATVDLYLYGTYLQYGGSFAVVPWAQEMRFSNNGSSWSSWEPYSPNKSWTLTSGNGVRTVWAQVRNGSQTYTSSDTIELDGDCSITTIQDDTLVGSHSYEDCEIHAGPSLEVMGDLSLHASRTVLRSGFSVAASGSLTIGPMP